MCLITQSAAIQTSGQLKWSSVAIQWALVNNGKMKKDHRKRCLCWKHDGLEAPRLVEKMMDPEVISVVPSVTFGDGPYYQDALRQTASGYSLIAHSSTLMGLPNIFERWVPAQNAVCLRMKTTKLEW